MARRGRVVTAWPRRRPASSRIVPDLALVYDAVRVAGNRVAYRRTFTGTHASSGHALRVSGWEEWDLDADHLVQASLGWFDAEDYARPTSGDIRER